MEKKSEPDAEGEAKKRAEARTAMLVGIIFGGLVLVMIVGMLLFDMYAEKHQPGGSDMPANSAAASDH